MTNKSDFSSSAIETAIRSLSKTGLPPSAVREVIIDQTHKALDAVLGDDPSGHFKRLLTEQAQDNIYDNNAVDDGTGIDGMMLLVNGFDSFLKKARDAMIEDGCDPSILMDFFITHAHEVLKEDEDRHAFVKRIRERVFKNVWDLHANYVDMEADHAARLLKNDPAPPRSAAHAISSEKLRALVDELRGEHGVSRQTLWKTMTSAMVATLKNHGASKADQRMLHRLLFDLGQDMDAIDNPPSEASEAA